MVSVRIPLTQGKFARVSIQDAERVMAFKWYAHRSNDHTYYAYRSETIAPKKRARILLHRFILGPPAGTLVDHINRDGLDCRRSNMRLATKSQNMSNSRHLSSNTSGLRGVRFFDGKWQAHLRHNGKSIYLGRFNTPEDAAMVWDAKAWELRGEYATLNFPERLGQVVPRSVSNQYRKVKA